MKKSLLSYLLVGAAGIALCAGNAKAQVVYVHHQAPAPAVEAAPVQTPAPVAQTPATTVTPAVSVAPAGNVQPSPVTVHDADSHFDFKANVPVSQPSPSVSVQETSGVIPSTEFGHDIPIGMAVSSIVPAGYNVQWKAMDQDKKVSWSGGRPWKDTLSTLTAANGYTMDVRGDQVIISGGDSASGGASVSPASATVTSVSPAESAKPAEAAKVPDGPVPGQSDDVIRHQDSTGVVTQKKSGDAEVVEPSSAARYGSSHGVALETHHAKSEDGNDLVLNVPDVKARRIAAMPTASYAPNGGGDGIYYAAPGQTIDQVLQIWSNANGWSVEYDAHMLYPVDMPTTLRGDYMEVVRTLLKSVSASPKPKYRFYKGNHVLRIYNFEDGS